MTKQVAVEELEQHLRERLDDVQRGQSLCVTDGRTPIARIEPFVPSPIDVIRHDPELRLRDFAPGRAVPRTDSVEWLIEQREQERSGKKHRS